MSNPETVCDNGGDETANIHNGGTADVIEDRKIAATPSNGHCHDVNNETLPSMLNGSDARKSDTSNSVEKDDDENVEDEEMLVKEEDDDEEEHLLMSLEEKAEQEADHLMIHQPKTVEEAPKLLQAALKGGQVKADESEEEEEEEEAAEDVAHAAVAASPEVHVHKRVRCHWQFVPKLLSQWKKKVLALILSLFVSHQ
jgi:hypothetical protein